jgi:hypothetical protein
MARDRERMFEAFGASSGELPALVEVVVVILSFYVTSVRLTVDVAAVTISQYAIHFHSVK